MSGQEAKKFFKIIITVLALWFLCTGLAILPVQTAKFKLDPSSYEFVEGCNSELSIMIDTEGQTSNAADIEIKYDPLDITVLDSNPNLGGIQIKNGTAYEAYFGNQVDTSSGTIRLAGASLFSPLTGKGKFATIQFKSKPGVTSTALQIAYDGPGATLDSNIAENSTSQDLLNGVTNAQITFRSDRCFPDTKAPKIAFVDPSQAADDGPDTIEVIISDDDEGIDLSTVTLNLNGVLYRPQDEDVQVTGDKSRYEFSFVPRNDYPEDEPSSLKAYAKDFANNQAQRIITFNYPPDEPPESPVCPTCECPSKCVPQIEYVDRYIYVPVEVIKEKEVKVEVPVEVEKIVEKIKTVTETEEVVVVVEKEVIKEIETIEEVLKILEKYERVTVIEPGTGSEDNLVVVIDGGEVQNIKEIEEIIKEITKSEKVTIAINKDGETLENIDQIQDYLTTREIQRISDPFTRMIFANDFIRGNTPELVREVITDLSLPGIVAGLLSLLMLGFLLAALALFGPSILGVLFGFWSRHRYIWGVVYDYETAEAVPFAKVALIIRDEEDRILETYTNPEGEYFFDQKYTENHQQKWVKVQKEGYEELTVETKGLQDVFIRRGWDISTTSFKEKLLPAFVWLYRYSGLLLFLGTVCAAWATIISFGWFNFVIFNIMMVLTFFRLLRRG